MRIIETKTYKVDLTPEDKKKFGEVIEFLNDLEEQIYPYYIEIENAGGMIAINYYDIDKIVALLNGFKEDDFKIIED